MRKFSALLATLTLVGAISAAEASPLNYDFTMTADSGPLSGDSASGTFSIDSSSVVPGGADAATGLLTSLDITWDGITYNATMANTGQLNFDAMGNLTKATFGTNCTAGTCGVAGGDEQWWVVADLNDSGGMAYSITGGGLGFGHATLEPAPAPAPEPLTLSLFGAGLAGAAAFRRKRKAA